MSVIDASFGRRTDACRRGPSCETMDQKGGDKVKYLSLFSGVEAATLAWEPLGWKPVAFAEFDAFPSAVLAHHYPNVPNLGDVTKIKGEDLNGSVELIVGGSPCQGFSVAGRQKGLEDPRSGLALAYVRLLDEVRPKWFVWENVPGVLSTNGGNDFKAFLHEITEIGYSCAWRILDAQHVRVDGFPGAIPQRRRRLFVVGHIADWRYPAEVLFESESLSGDTEESGGKGQAAAGGAQGIARSADRELGADTAVTLKIRSGCEGGGKGALWQVEKSATLATNNDQTLFAPTQARMLDDVCPTLLAEVAAKHFSGNQEIFSGKYFVYENHPQDARIKEVDVCPALSARTGTGGGNLPLVQRLFNTALTYGSVTEGKVCKTLAAHMDNQTDLPLVLNQPEAYGITSQNSNAMKSGNPHSGVYKAEVSKTLDASCVNPSCNQGGIAVVDRPTYALAENTIGREPLNGGNGNGFSEGVSYTLNATGVHGVCDPTLRVRRLTPVECERLMGFPDDYTKVPYRGKSAEDCPDSQRYKACGNSMCVNVMRWIGQRIEAVENRSKQNES